MGELKYQSFPPIPQVEKSEPDNEVYERASLIVQTTNRCSKRCPGCYLSENPATENQELDQSRYEECIGGLKEGDTVALRGGEITLLQDWFERFATPALEKGLKIIIETNGYFIETKDYQDVLEKMNNDKISVRISFDLEHLKGLQEEKVASEFEKMARFAEDAENAGINFGFYALGMDGAQIQKFVQGTPLEQFTSKFHSLAFHPQISNLKINGQYLKSDGKLSDRIEV